MTAKIIRLHPQPPTVQPTPPRVLPWDACPEVTPIADGIVLAEGDFSTLDDRLLLCFRQAWESVPESGRRVILAYWAGLDSLDRLVWPVFPVVEMAMTTGEPWHDQVNLGALVDYGTRFVIRPQFVAIAPNDQIRNMVAQLLSLIFVRAQRYDAAREYLTTLTEIQRLKWMAEVGNEQAGVGFAKPLAAWGYRRRNVYRWLRSSDPAALRLMEMIDHDFE